MIGALLIAQLAVVAHAPRSVGACEPLELSVAVSASGTVVPRLVAPSFEPFAVMRVATMPDGRRDTRAVPPTMVEYRYVLATDRPGEYTIPPFEVRLGSARAYSAPLHVIVTPATGTEAPTVITRARIDTGERLDLRTTVPDTVYVGQQANYSVAVFLNNAMRNRLRRNPTFYPPDMQSMLAYDVPGAGTQQRTPGLSGCFDALVYRRALFPLQAGRLVIPPAQLTYSLPVGASFFSREETHELQTDSAVVVAIDPPEAGRPTTYDGAVGRFRVRTRLEARSTRVGDPFTITVRVTGTGNVRLLPRPRLNVPWASAVPSEERVHVDSTAARIGGSKDFDWVLTPRIAGELDVPPVQYSYFNPRARRYETASSDAVLVKVDPGTLVAVDTGRRASVLAVRSTFTGPVHRPLSSNPVFWIVLALAPVPALGSRWRGRRRPVRTRVLPGAGRMEEAAAAVHADGDGRLLRHTYVAVLADRLGIDAETFTRPDALRRALRRSGVSEGTAADAESLLRDLDAAAFAAEGALAAAAGRRTVEIVRLVDDEALPRAELPFRGALLALLVVIGVAGTAHALQSVNPQNEFSNGVVAYHERDYAGARAAFARVVAAVPRSADAWVNLGTASWAVHDTADAVAGWRRGLGLEPLAGDARTRLSLVHGLRLRSPGYVPPVPLDVVLVAMALCWLAACAGWHPAVHRRYRWIGGWPTPLAVTAAVLGLAAIALGGRLSGRGLAVVQSNLALRSDPALGADQGAIVESGEIIRVLSQHGAWDRVELDGGRQGWVPAERLLPLDRPPTVD